MERGQFKCVKIPVTAASAPQTIEIEGTLQHDIARQFAEIALARRTRQTIRTRNCPHCQSNDILLHGKDQNRRQRFKCRGCRRTYNILTGTPMARARMPEKWGQYLDCMTEHMSVRRIVASGIGLHQVTAWRWRHRFLHAAANDNASVLAGVIEADDTFFPRSFKGSRRRKNGGSPGNRAARFRACDATKRGAFQEQVPVLTALDSGGAVFEAILASLNGIEAALKGRIAPDSVLCSNGNAAYAIAADTANVRHYSVTGANAGNPNPGDTPAGSPGRLGLRRVRNHHRQLKYLIHERCRGVATKYLCNYLGWQRAMTRQGFEGRTLLALSLV